MYTDNTKEKEFNCKFILFHKNYLKIHIYFNF